MPASISSHGQSTLPDGRVLVSGGYNGSKVINNVYIYEPSSNTWETVASLPNSFRLHGQSTLSDGGVLVSGGMDIDNNALNTSYIYDVNQNIWDSIRPMTTNFGAHGQSTLNDGSVLVSGGANASGFINNSYIYNSTNNTWSVAPTAFGSQYPGQSTLFDGGVLVSGGMNIGGWGVYKDCYVYTPSNNAWASIASMPVNYGAHGQSTLADGKVLISGGYYDGATRYNDVYIYTTNAGVGLWASVASLTTKVSFHGQSTLADGRVLVSGGNGANGNTTYIYTPTGWVAVGNNNLFIMPDDDAVGCNFGNIKPLFTLLIYKCI